ncbi:hypothetical protein OH77DRAFT_1305455 [Trametes cingulata]|nr:hypothetical protein OH77DRAFT_1305455 [Trametes cingulata]
MPEPSRYRGRGCVYNAPLALNSDLSRTDGLEPDDPRIAWRRLEHYVRESIDCIVGPMPVQVFIDTFLPDRPDDMKAEVLTSKNAFKAVPTSGATPSAIYQPLIAALNKSTKHKSRAPGLVFENASERSEHPHQPGYMKPHICCYTSKNLDYVRSAPISGRAELGYAELFMEVQADIAFDFFVDPIPGATAKELRSHEFVMQLPPGEFRRRVQRAWGQHFAYAVEIQARQPRGFLYSVAICGSYARLLRWDRSGVIVSTSFDYRERPDVLCEFLDRFAFATNMQRGHDVTVDMATSEEEEQFKDVITAHVHDQLGLSGEDLFKAVSEHYQPGHVMGAHVFVQTGGGTEKEVNVERFLISRPVASPLALGGRATRAHWAVHARTGQVVFLKDTWRLPRDREGDILASLHAAGVRNIPTLVAHGDVYWRWPKAEEGLSRFVIQYTLNDGYTTKPWACYVAGRRTSTVAHIHYRLVLGTVGYGLKRFRGTNELLHGTYDAFQAMRDAFSNASRLHRDISVGNIILVQESPGEVRKGYLVDWEASSGIDNEGCALDKFRMGTWSFMSSKILLEPEEPHKFEDDMESLLYVVLHCALLHLPHNLLPDELQPLMHEFFDDVRLMVGKMCGGVAKRVDRTSRFLTERIKWTNPDLKAWFDTVWELYGRHPIVRGRAHPWSDPNNLDALWKTFLAEHTLAADDRVDNELPEPEEPSNECRGSEAPFIVPEVLRSALTKRKAAGETDATGYTRATRASKRLKASEPIPATVSLRRSQRVRARCADNVRIPADMLGRRPRNAAIATVKPRRRPKTRS